jgi:hypothetical protein
MATLGDFLSLDAGRKRREWLDGTIRELFEYITPPNLRPTVEMAAQMNPIQGMSDSMSQFGVAMDPNQTPEARRSAALSSAIEAGLAVAPAALAAKGYLTPAQGTMESLLGWSPAGQQIADDVGRFVADETGAIRVWHGSPHDFDRFDMDQIGTGEGNQVYGHGLYFAENPETARAYRDTLSSGFGWGPQEDLFSGVSDDAKLLISVINRSGNLQDTMPPITAGLSSEVYPEWLEVQLKEAVEELRALGSTKDWDEPFNELLEATKNRTPDAGHLYEVNIDANPEDFLDWDKPLSEQAENIQQAFLRAQTRNDPLLSELIDLSPEGMMLQGMVPDAKGSAAYGTYAGDLTPYSKNPRQLASQELNDAGIRGISYLDQGSRDAGEGTRNYVVFDDSLLSILSKDGSPTGNNPFPNSQIQDEVYHRTAQQFDDFQLGGDRSGQAVWFSMDRNNLPTGRPQEGERLVRANVNLQNPLMLDEFNLREMQDRWAGGSKEFPFYLTDDTRQRLLDADFDGVISEDVYGDGTVGELLVLDPAQIRQLGSEPLVPNDRLVAHHNLSPEGVRVSSEIGGIPMPSLAISRADYPLTGYGDVTLLADPSMAKPSSTTGVWDADVYTGRQPRGDIEFVDDKAASDAMAADPDFGHFKDASYWTGAYNDFEQADNLMKLAQRGKDEGIDPKGFQDFDSYIREVRKQLGYGADAEGYEGLRAYGETERVLYPRDLFTPSGNRRKPSKYTLDRVMRYMREGNAGMPSTETTSTGPSELRAVSSNPLRTMGDIMDARNRILPPDETKGAIDAYNDDYWALRERLTGGGSYNESERAGGLMHDIAEGADFREWYDGDITDETMSEILELSKRAGELPTAYFEAKPRRAVSLSEFPAALVPESDEETRALLESAGVKQILTYGSPEERKELFKRFPELLFALGGAATIGSALDQQQQGGI